jgi:PAS domain S-box-containing protein
MENLPATTQTGSWQSKYASGTRSVGVVNGAKLIGCQGPCSILFTNGLITFLHRRIAVSAVAKWFLFSILRCGNRDSKACHVLESAVSEEILLAADDLIVSKTDTDSLITYANPEFCRYSGYQEYELLGKPQNIVRHPDMPRAMFELMYSHLQQRQEFFGYIKSRSKNGGFYWTFASMAPVYENGQHSGYISVRRCPSRDALKIIEPIYQRMHKIEASLPRAEQIPNSSAELRRAISKEFSCYAEFVLSL